jgi:putative ABC transport system permease protein
MKYKKDKPPRLASAILYLLQYYREEHLITSDLNSEYMEITGTKGALAAFVWYWGQVLYAVWSDFRQSLWFSGAMIKNMIKINLRNLKRQRLHAFINIAGLAVGLTVSMLMFQYIHFEMSFDNFHLNADRIYRINAHDLERDLKFAGTQALLAQTLKQDFPEVEKAARLKGWAGYFKHSNQAYYEDNLVFADPDFKDIFTYPLKEGDMSALAEPFSLFISLQIAEKYFGSEDPVGKVLAFNNKHEFIVRGILRNIPENSYLQFDLLASMGSLETIWGHRWLNRWVSHDFNTFILLSENSEESEFKKKLGAFIRPPDVGHEEERDVFYSQPLKNIHFGAGLRNEIGQTNASLYIQILTAAAILILLLACLNYTTLATARAAKRVQEIGLRKVIGAGRLSLLKQFLGESMIFALLAFSISVLSVEFLLPSFNQLMDRSLSISPIIHFPLFLGISLLVGLVSGFYPALYLSSFQPSQIFRGRNKKDPQSSALLHRSLVMTQFIITMALLICILIVKNQIGFLVKNSVRIFEDPVVTITLNDDA